MAKLDTSQEEFRKKAEAERKAKSERERASLERAYVEKPLCWRIMAALGWIAGVGGLAVLMEGMLGLMGMSAGLSIGPAGFVIIGAASLAGGVFSLYLRPQWTKTLMEMRALQERAGARIASTDMDRLAQNEAVSEARLRESNDKFVAQIQGLIQAGSQDTANRITLLEKRMEKIVQDDEYSRASYNFLAELGGRLTNISGRIEKMEKIMNGGGPAQTDASEKAESAKREPDPKTLVKERVRSKVNVFGTGIVVKPRNVTPAVREEQDEDSIPDPATDDYSPAETDAEEDGSPEFDDEEEPQSLSGTAADYLS